MISDRSPGRRLAGSPCRSLFENCFHLNVSLCPTTSNIYLQWHTSVHRVINNKLRSSIGKYSSTIRLIGVSSSAYVIFHNAHRRYWQSDRVHPGTVFERWANEFRKIRRWFEFRFFFFYAVESNSRRPSRRKIRVGRPVTGMRTTLHCS